MTNTRYQVTIGEYDDAYELGEFDTLAEAHAAIGAHAVGLAASRSGGSQMMRPYITKQSAVRRHTCGDAINGSDPCAKSADDEHTMHRCAHGCCEWGYGRR